MSCSLDWRGIGVNGELLELAQELFENEEGAVTRD
jgi:hypothetical protein